MAKHRVLDLARQMGNEDGDLLLRLKRMGVKVKVPKPEREALSSSGERIITASAGKEIIEKRVKPTVILRRVRIVEATTGLPVLPSQTAAMSGTPASPQ
ncbi:MAG: hypothetical protein EHM36_09855, partial [Deltaproteobacteria bacterium]